MLNKYQGHLYVLLSSLFFASYGVWAKLLDPAMGTWSQGYIRGIIASIILLSLIIYYKKWIRINREDYKIFAIFALCCVLTVGPITYAVINTNVGIANLLFFTSYTVIQFILGITLLNEKLNKYKILSLILALAGLVIIFKDSLSYYAILPLLAAIISGVASGSEIISTKFIPSKYSVMQISIIGWLGIIVTNYLLSILNNETLPSFEFDLGWLAIFLYAIFGMLAFMFVIFGYKKIDAMTGSLIGLTEIIFALLFGILFFQEKLTLAIIFGSILIIASGSISTLSAQKM